MPPLPDPQSITKRLPRIRCAIFGINFADITTLIAACLFSKRSPPQMRWSKVLATAAFALVTTLAHAESVLRYAISMADIPLTTGQPDRGAGAYQFTGYTLYDPLVAWEMDVADRPGKLVPGLATKWEVDPADQRKWKFALRQGVKFHDGSPFN